MKDPGSTLGEQAASVSAHSPRDTNIALLRAGLSLMPGGGLVVEALNQIPARRAQRQQAFLERVAAEVEAVRHELDADFVKSGEFADMLEDVLEKTAERTQMDKVGYYAAALAHSAVRDAPPEAERSRMLDLLEGLRPPHLDLLALVVTTKDGAPPGMYMGGVDQTIQFQWPDANLDQVKMDWGDLARLGVLQSYPSGVMKREGATDLSVRLTQFGHRFHDFIGLERMNALRRAAAG